MTEMKKSNCIAIAGMGLIGGSLAKALRLRAGVEKIIGIDPDPEQLLPAVSSGIIDEGYPEPGTYLSDCSMVIVCAPVPVCVNLVTEISRYINSSCVITDAASTKSDIVRTIKSNEKSIRFIGGHPMAGSERSGFAYSREDMFENAYYLIMDDENDREAVEKVRAMAESIGSIPILTNPETHDEAVAVISHIPHVAAAALVSLLDESEGMGLARQIAAGGFRDVTRIASSQPALWRDITLNNRKAVSEGLNKLIGILTAARDNINCLKGTETEEFFKKAKDTRDLISGEREGLLPRKFQIVIQVADRPGVIARISALLGENNLNIKNINVTHSREDVGGVLVVELYSLEDRNKAIEILVADGFNASLID
jgi:prephenate dehydrogenase